MSAVYTTHEPCPAEVGPPMPPGQYRDVWPYQRIQSGVLGDECRYLCPVGQEQGAHDGVYWLVREDRLRAAMAGYGVVIVGKP